MKSIYVQDLQRGQIISGETFAIQECALTETKDKKPYYKLKLIDKTGSISGQIWSDNFASVERKQLKIGNVISISAKVDEFKGSLQLNILSANGVSESALDEYMEASDFDLDELWQKLWKHVQSIESKELRAFVEFVFEDSDLKRLYRTGPAAEHVHHSFQGGLIEHVCEMLDLAVALRSYYKEANFDLVIVGAIMHDIGKLRELKVEGTVVQRTTEGHLLGHLLMSYEMLLEKAKGKLSSENLLCLKHIILSHHGELEFGSPVVPATIEAAIVHAVDHASSQVRIFQKILRKNAKTEGAFSDWDNIVRTRVYLGEKTGETNELEQLMF